MKKKIRRASKRNEESLKEKKREIKAQDEEVFISALDDLIEAKVRQILDEEALAPQFEDLSARLDNSEEEADSYMNEDQVEAKIKEVLRGI